MVLVAIRIMVVLGLSLNDVRERKNSHQRNQQTALCIRNSSQKKLKMSVNASPTCLHESTKPCTIFPSRFEANCAPSLWGGLFMAHVCTENFISITRRIQLIPVISVKFTVVGCVIATTKRVTESGRHSGPV